jgi:hypothetical protein
MRARLWQWMEGRDLPKRKHETTAAVADGDVLHDESALEGSMLVASTSTVPSLHAMEGLG